MRSVLYLSVNPFETRVALRENGGLVSYRAERHRTTSIVGNIYKGRVTRVLPGMQAAFVDIGLTRDAFLYVREAGGILDEYIELFGGERDESNPPDVGDSAISDLLRQGQEILVQVIKDPLGTKGARLTTYITLPGRFLVYLPTTGQRGVSRRIIDPEERERLRGIISDYPGGWIVRTAGESQEAPELDADRDALIDRWQRLQENVEHNHPPVLLARELSPLLRSVRDLLTARISECWIDDEEGYREVLDFLEQSDPAMTSKVNLFRHSKDMMSAHGIDRELEKALRPKIWLKSGGYLVVNQTEALVAIDVNSGKFVGSTDLEDTVFQINLEAVREVARQLRLRDLGGIIIVDIIDMEDEDHRREVHDTLQREVQRDPARTQLFPISDLGLIQMTRKRTRPSLDRALSRPCPHCHGTGRIKSLPTICLEIRRKILDMDEESIPGPLSIQVHPEISHYLQGPFRELMRELEETHGIEIILRENPLFHQEQFEIE